VAVHHRDRRAAATRESGVPAAWYLDNQLNDQVATSSRKIGIESAEGVLGLEPTCFNRRVGDVVLAQWPSAPQLLREVWWRAVPEKWKLRCRTIRVTGDVRSRGGKGSSPSRKAQGVGGGAKALPQPAARE
jgi:hypothetical protein